MSQLNIDNISMSCYETVNQHCVRVWSCTLRSPRKNNGVSILYPFCYSPKEPPSKKAVLEMVREQVKYASFGFEDWCYRYWLLKSDAALEIYQYCCRVAQELPHINKGKPMFTNTLVAWFNPTGIRSYGIGWVSDEMMDEFRKTHNYVYQLKPGRDKEWGDTHEKLCRVIRDRYPHHYKELESLIEANCGLRAWGNRQDEALGNWQFIHRLLY